MASFVIIIIVGSLSPSAVVSAQGSIPLITTPSGLVATPVSANQIDLSWNAPTQNYGKTIVGYEIEQLTGGIYYIIVDSTSSKRTTYSVTGLDLGKTYTFRVSAVYSDDTTTDPSNSSSASLTSSQESILVTTDKSSYNPGDLVKITLHLPKFQQGQTIAIIVTNPSGNILVSKTLNATSQNSSIQIGLPQTAQIGKYEVNATSMYNIFISPSGWESHSLFKGLDQFTVMPLAFSPNDVSVISPLKQFKTGISANEIKCKQNLVLITKTENNSPACVKPQTAQKLVERGWGIHVDVNGTLDFTIIPMKGPIPTCTEYVISPTNESNNLSNVRSERLYLYQNIIVNPNDSVTIEPPGDKLTPNLKGEKIHVAGFLFEHPYPYLVCGNMLHPVIVPSVIEILG